VEFFSLFGGLGWIVGPEVADCKKIKACLFHIDFYRLPERGFSSVGHTITGTVSRLSAGKVESIELIRWGCALACCE